MIKFKQITNCEISLVEKLAQQIWHECYSDLLSLEQRLYMLNKFLSAKAISESLKNGYIYELIYLQEKPVGFFAYKSENTEIFLSKIYILNFARGHKIASLVIVYLKQAKVPIYLTVNKYNNSAINVYTHLGFTITSSVINDIGNGYIMDDYIMRLIINRVERK